MLASKRASCCLIVAALATAQAAPVPAHDLSSAAETGSGCFDDDEALIALVLFVRNRTVPGCEFVSDRGGCQYEQIRDLCDCSCTSTPPPPSLPQPSSPPLLPPAAPPSSPPPSAPPASSPPTSPPPGWANGDTHFDISFGDHPHQKLDLYETSAAAGMPPVPCILFVHGGGWAGGDKDDVPVWALALRQRGYHVASTNYRLTSNDDTHPAQIEDVESAVRYLKTNASTYNLNASMIVAIGPSAGGHLVSLLGTRNGPHSVERVAAVVDLFGPPTLYANGSSSSEQIVDLLGCNTSDVPNTLCYEAALNASPDTHVAASNPPFLIFQGTADTTTPLNASVYFQSALEAAGADSTLAIVPGVGHDKNRIMCGVTDGLANWEHLYNWLNATLSLGAPGGIFVGGGTIYGDEVDAACAACCGAGADISLCLSCVGSDEP